MLVCTQSILFWLILRLENSWLNFPLNHLNLRRSFFPSLLISEASGQEVEEKWQSCAEQPSVGFAPGGACEGARRAAAQTRMRAYRGKARSLWINAHLRYRAQRCFLF